jgi:uncharacterized OB-fold protein
VTSPDPALKYVLRDMNAPAREFYRRLDGGELAATFCVACDEFGFPPRTRCPRCSGATEWRRLSGRGSVYSFTQQTRALRFVAPEVIGIAELEEGVRVFGVFEAPFETLAIGAPVEVRPRKDGSGLTLLGFRPRG